MISSTSRYASSSISVVNDARGSHQSVDPRDNFSGVVNYTYYQVAEYDTPEWIAYSTYGDGKLWWYIADANPEILDWSNVATGTVIRIPNG